jgi:hypothetical protein
MAKIQFRGVCSGTEERLSKKTGNPYKITKFVEFPSLQTFEVFGDLGLPAHEDVRDYVLEASVTGLGNVKVVSPTVTPKK